MLVDVDKPLPDLDLGEFNHQSQIINHQFRGPDLRGVTQIE
jgi:hypothetical protein